MTLHSAKGLEFDYVFLPGWEEEIFPNNVRSYGNSLGAGTHWVFAALIAATFPYVTGILGAGPTFAVFTIMTVFQLFFVWKMMPETKGKSLEELQSLFVK